jgi:peptide deformylase
MSVCILHRSFRRVVARTLMLAGLAVMLAGPLAATRASAAEVTILEDDYAAALGKAKARGVLLFVDGWAPWCHSCVFFREHVLPNASLGDLADRYVFASIDTEKEINRRFVERFPMTAWPTFFVIDPSTEKVRWVGTQLLDRAGLQRTLENEDALFRREKAARTYHPKAPLEAAAALRAEGKRKQAAQRYEQLLRIGVGLSDVDAGAAFEALLSTHLGLHDTAACFFAAKRFAPRVAPRERVPGLALGLFCASSFASTEPEALRVLVSLADASLAQTDVLADDRSSLFEAIVGVADALHDEALAWRMGEAWLSFLEAEAAHAKTSRARAAFDAHRMSAALAIREPARALPALAQTESEFPEDYNAPARSAVLLRELGRLDEALAAVDRALRHVAGPRRHRVLETKASVLHRLGRSRDEAEVLLDAIVEAQSIADGARREGTIARLTSMLADARFRTITDKDQGSVLPVIVQAGDPELRLRAVDVPKEVLGTEAFQRLLGTLAAVMRRAPGVGLAAPQIGIPWRLFVVEDSDERMAKLTASEREERGRRPVPLTVIINPEVRTQGDAKAAFFEGCLSVSGYAGLVERHLAVDVTALDEVGASRTFSFRGWPARIVQHELDHVNGTLYVDRMEPRSFGAGDNVRRFTAGRPMSEVRRLVGIGAEKVEASAR